MDLATNTNRVNKPSSVLEEQITVMHNQVTKNLLTKKKKVTKNLIMSNEKYKVILTNIDDSNLLILEGHGPFEKSEIPYRDLL